MADTLVTITGNATADAEVKFLPNGSAVAEFNVASTPRHFDKASGDFKDGTTTFLRVKAWRQLAEGAADKVRKGEKVVVTGKLKQRNWETKEGEKRTTFELEADDIGISVRERGGSSAPKPPPANDPWGSNESAPF